METGNSLLFPPRIIHIHGTPMLTVPKLIPSIFLCGLWAIAAHAGPGDIDPDFNVGTAAKSPIMAVAVDDQNRLIVVGSFTEFNGVTTGRILRLNENGSMDSSFSPGSGANSDIKAVKILPDKRILIGGQFTTYNGANSRGLALLNQNGTLDTSFSSGFASDGFSVGVACMELLPGNQVLVGGYFTKYANLNVGRLVRINHAGAIVATPPPVGASSHVLDIDLLPDGEILIGGFFETVDNHSSRCVARLLSSGIVDTSFSTGTNLSSVAYSVQGLSDGKVLVGGNFSNYFGMGARYLGRLTSSGANDPTYLGTNGPNLNVYGMTLDSQERLILAGQFSQFNGTPMNGIGRLMPDGTRDTSFQFSRSVGPSFFQEYPIDSQGRILVFGWSNFFLDPTKSNLLRLAGGNASVSETWLIQHFGSAQTTGDAAWDATPAGDGIANLVKYALGFQPSPRTPTRLWGDDGLLFGFWNEETSSGFRFRTDLSRTDASAIPEWSEQLTGWTASGMNIAEESREGQVVTWKATLSGNHPNVFFRIRAELHD